MEKYRDGLKIILAIIAIVAISFLGIKHFFTPESDVYAMYNREQIIKNCQEQIKDIDISKVRKKEDLILEKSIREIQDSVARGQLSYEDLTAFYLDRIINIDQMENGVNAVSEVNPRAIEEARKLDRETRPNKGILYGMPITLKENINTSDLVTSCGVYGFRDFKPEKDAQLVERLRSENAIILAKVNLSELANFVDMRMPQGYSNKHGQTLNPYKPIEITPSGSSSGSAVSVASNIGLVSIATETSGSIISPAAINSTVGFKPSRDRISKEGVFPLSKSLDTVGIISKNTEDIIYSYNILVDEAAYRVEDEDLEKDKLKNKRIGILNNNNDLFKLAKEELEELGAEVIELGKDLENLDIDGMEIVLKEFKFAFEDFAEKEKLPIKTIEELIDYNNQDPNQRALYGQEYLELVREIRDYDEEELEQIIEGARENYQEILEKDELDALGFFNADLVYLTAVAGAPELTLPLWSHRELPVGLTLTTGLKKDKELLAMGHDFYKVKKRRIYPDLELEEGLRIFKVIRNLYSEELN